MGRKGIKSLYRKCYSVLFSWLDYIPPLGVDETTLAETVIYL